MKPDIKTGTLRTDRLVAQLTGGFDSTVTVTNWLWASIGALGKFTHRPTESACAQGE